MIDDEILKCALCSKEQKSMDNLIEENFHINNDPKCGHRFCSRCCDINYSKKRNFACPICQTIVKKENLSTSSYDDLEIQRDVRIRKKVKAIFNRYEKDFSTLLEFQEYEEMVEDIIFNLVHGIDKEKNELKIKEYEKMNIIQIAQKQSQYIHHQKIIEEKILLDEKEKEERLYSLQQEEKLLKSRDLAYKKSMNEYIIGEGDFLSIPPPPLPSSSSSSSGLSITTNTATTSNILHPVYILLSQRPEPKAIIPDNTSTTSHSTSSMMKTGSKSSVLTHTAGGFKPQTYRERNMREILSSFQLLDLRGPGHHSYNSSIAASSSNSIAASSSSNSIAAGSSSSSNNNNNSNSIASNSMEIDSDKNNTNSSHSISIGSSNSMDSLLKRRRKYQNKLIITAATTAVS